jgi:hypothetical protein
MTQAMNLANFSNYLDASGQVAPTVLNAVVPISKGGTASATASAARTALGLAIGTDVAAQAYAFPSGGIIMWSGTIATIPSGWLLCNGSSGTPDLRNKFIVGAYLDNAGVANTTITGSNTQTGGSKDAIVPYHTHTATSTDAGHAHATVGGIGNAQGGGASSGAQYVQGTTPTTTSGTATASITTTLAYAGSSGNVTNANLVPYYALAFIMKS